MIRRPHAPVSVQPIEAMAPARTAVALAPANDNRAPFKKRLRLALIGATAATLCAGLAWLYLA